MKVRNERDKKFKFELVEEIVTPCISCGHAAAFVAGPIVVVT